MSSDRVEQLLRRASDDVRATVVRHTVPPPIEVLDDHGHPFGRALVGMAAVTVTVTLGLAIVGDRSTSVPPPIDAPAPVSTVAREVAPAAGGDDLCNRVVGIAEVLADWPDEIEVWAALGDDLDALATQLARSRNELDPETVRRYDRFVALADSAVALGTEGGFTPAGVRADLAVAVAVDLVDVVAVPGCELDAIPRPSEEEDPE